MSEINNENREKSLKCYETNGNYEKIHEETNKAIVYGIFEDEFIFNHNVKEKKFYKSRIIVKRKSGVKDYIPIIISDELMKIHIGYNNVKGKCARISGKFHSYTEHGGNGKKYLKLFLFVNEIILNPTEEEDEECKNNNFIYLDGYIDKLTYRRTPAGKDITDVMICVKRKHNKSDYIPCIAWGEMAYFIAKTGIGKRVKIYGRIQSRQYFKRFCKEFELGEYKEAYEVSIFKVVVD